MELIINQIETFIFMLGFGLLAGFVFDIYQLIMKKFKVNKINIHIADIIFSIILGLAGFSLLLFVNRGIFRFYELVAIVIGLILHYFIKKLIKYPHRSSGGE